ncbi:hypothetical protein BT96DRAFT_918369 [Gymnopus androsaceus JB14]|uniref:Uncharacterized protein n=1 Tax=Gymnopus androsaceus JB14 TaxID=1447944 RepID=A0A6A4HZ00_9AGAR|nr:hypothetical protein BT96DRAFT_918369 [Gymnopus androsaceus JB14]
MRFKPFFAIRCAVAIYGLALECLYPFNSLPFAISISDELQESLKFQTHDSRTTFLPVASLSFLVLFCYFVLSITTILGVIGIVMRYYPAFREKVQKCVAERAQKTQNKKKPSKRAVWASLTFNILFSVAMVINDAIFNRSEDAASLKDGAIERYNYVFDNVMQVVIFGCWSLITCARALRALYRGYRAHRQQRAVADQESGLLPSETAEVEVEGKKVAFVLAEMLVDFYDGIDGWCEKMGAYAASTRAPATEPVEEKPLIGL